MASVSWAASVVSSFHFCTCFWNALRLLSEHGYGTIGSSIATYDTRRMGSVDNNPAGHNTVIIKQASSGTVGESDEGSFAQFNNIAGSVSFAQRNGFVALLLGLSRLRPSDKRTKRRTKTKAASHTF